MTTPTIRKLNLTLITAVAALIASCNSGNASNNQQPQNTNATTISAKQLRTSNNGISNMLTGFGKVGTAGYESTIPVLCFQNGPKIITHIWAILILILRPMAQLRLSHIKTTLSCI